MFESILEASINGLATVLAPVLAAYILRRSNDDK